MHILIGCALGMVEGIMADLRTVAAKLEEDRWMYEY